MLMLGLAGQGAVESLLLERAVLAQAASPVALKLRKEPQHLDVIITGIGDSARVVQERSRSTSWRGEITRSDDGLSTKEVAQQLAMPEIGVANVRFRGSGSSYQLEVTSVAGTVLPKPKILATGDDLVLRFRGLTDVASTRQTGSFDLRRPGGIPQRVSAPPLKARAVAPPLGDMAVGSMLINNRSFVQVSGPSVTLTLNNAPAKDALLSLARLGDYGFIFVNSIKGSDQSASDQVESPGPGITMSFRDESYAKALNSVLMASGLQGKLDGRTLVVGASVSSKTFGPQISKVYRLNQSSAVSAAKYLAALGATFEPIAASSNASSAEVGVDKAPSKTDGETRDSRSGANSYDADKRPLIGLFVTTDSRLQTITLIGDSSVVAIAENYLRQLDLRQRQVALSVKILDVNLSNDAAIDNSFAFRYGNNFIVSDRGELVGAFGALLPPTDGAFDVIAGGESSGKSEYVEVDDDSNQVAVDPLDPAAVNPGTAYEYDTFYDLFRALVESGNTKTLSSPTLILSENPDKLFGDAVAVGDPSDAFSNASIGREYANEGFITVGQQVTTNFEVTPGQNGAPNSCQPETDTSGLTFGARVLKIDDNGFVTFSLSPSISAVTGTELIEGCGVRSILSVRRLDTGSVRVRDGHTLVLTGVISEADAQVVRKWPILGDIPLIGQFFRQSSSSRYKSELVILVTPRIIDDNHGASYGYRPQFPAARQIMSGS